MPPSPWVGTMARWSSLAAKPAPCFPCTACPGWKGVITGLRIAFDNPGPARVVIKSFHTACDTRHNINNSNFIRGCHDYFLWSGDLTFLRGQIGRIRTAMRFMMREFDTRARKCVYTTWPGHEGRSGVRRVGGKTVIVRRRRHRQQLLGPSALRRRGRAGHRLLLQHRSRSGGVGRADRRSPAVECRRPAPTPSTRPTSANTPWRSRTTERNASGTTKTGRFGTVDLDGNLHDYGFTFLNNEAVYYDFATPEQARSIHAWLSGQRVVEGDTSTGQDIYRWRFAPRSTTRRNLDYYFWGWSNPESVPWGYQV